MNCPDCDSGVMAEFRNITLDNKTNAQYRIEELEGVLRQIRRWIEAEECYTELVRRIYEAAGNELPY